MALQRKTPLRPRSPKKAKDTTIDWLLKSGKVSKASTFTAKPKPMRKRRPKRDGEQSQIEFFTEIWNERRHVSAISGQDLVDRPDDMSDKAQLRAWISQFSHILPKGTYRKMKSDKRNIVLKTAHEHHLWETDKSNLRGKSEWEWVFRLEKELMDEANGVSG